MIKSIRRLPSLPRLSYANVVATLALFVGLGGVSYAAMTLPKNSVHSKQIAKAAVRTSDLGKAAVTGAKLAPGAVTQAHISAGAVGAGQLGDGAVGTGKLADGAVTAGKIAAPEAPHHVGAAGEPAFNSNNQRVWSNVAGPNSNISFYKDQVGMVHLFGTALCAPLIAGGCQTPQAGVIFTLPPGYRPPQTLDIPVVSGNSANPLGEIYLYGNGSGSDGEILVHADNAPGGASTIVLDNITYPGS